MAVGKALNTVSWGVGVDATKVNAHTAFLPAWLAAVAKQATDELRPTYGRYYGFEASVPRNAEMMALTMFSGRFPCPDCKTADCPTHDTVMKTSC